MKFVHHICLRKSAIKDKSYVPISLICSNNNSDNNDNWHWITVTLQLTCMTDIPISGCGCFLDIFRWREMKTTETVQLSRRLYSNYIAKHQLSKNGYSKSKCWFWMVRGNVLKTEEKTQPTILSGVHFRVNFLTHWWKASSLVAAPNLLPSHSQTNLLSPTRVITSIASFTFSI